jgi:Flp pilus assembly protein TadG
VRPASIIAADSFLRDESGGSTFEMALCSIIVLFMLMGVMEGALALYTEHAVDSMARDAARYAMVRGSDYAGTTCATSSTASCNATATNVSTYLNNNLPPGVVAASLNVKTTWPGTNAAGNACDTTLGTNSAGCTVHVTVTYPFTFLLPVPTSMIIHFGSDATMTITQ